MKRILVTCFAVVLSCSFSAVVFAATPVASGSKIAKQLILSEEEPAPPSEPAPAPEPK